MNTLSEVRFDALPGYSRSPYISLSARELGWFQEADTRVLAVVSLHVVDRDYVWTVLAHHAINRYRAVDLRRDIPTPTQAKGQLAQALTDHALRPVENHHQGDEVRPLVDLFAPAVPDSRQDKNFKVLLDDGHSPAREREFVRHFFDVDRNFIERSQSTGFDGRSWGLYPFALLIELAYGLGWEHAAPGFHCVGMRGDCFLEATTRQPLGDPASYWK